MSNANQLWLQIQNQLPDYIRSDPAYAQLVNFLNAYYTWLQLEGELHPLELIADTEKNRSIDSTIDQFVKYFSATFLDDFPLLYDPDEPDSAIKAHKRKQITRLIKHADELFISKGTEDSFRTLFRILFDEEITLFYPKTVILKPSDGRWVENVTIKINVTSGNIADFNLTYGSASAVESLDGTLDHVTGASATIEQIIAHGSFQELYITRGSLVGVTKAYAASSGHSDPFMPGNQVVLKQGSVTVIGTILPTARVLPQTFGTQAVAVGDLLYALRLTAPVGNHPTIQFKVKSIHADGSLKAVSVVDSGSDYVSAYNILVDAFNHTVGVVTLSGLTYYAGFYETVEGVHPGFLSDQIKLRGPLVNKLLAGGHTPSEYYQEFSYVIKSSVPPDVWMATVRKLLHPSGYEIFGDIVFNPTADGGFNILGLYHFNQDDVNDLDVYTDYKYHEVLITPFGTPIVLKTDTRSSVKLGPTLESLNKFMMLFPPYAGGIVYYGATVGVSSGDWGSESNNLTQIKDYASLVVGDFYAGNARNVKSNIMPQTYVIVTP